MARRGATPASLVRRAPPETRNSIRQKLLFGPALHIQSSHDNARSFVSDVEEWSSGSPRNLARQVTQARVMTSSRAWGYRGEGCCVIGPRECFANSRASSYVLGRAYFRLARYDRLSNSQQQPPLPSAISTWRKRPCEWKQWQAKGGNAARGMASWGRPKSPEKRTAAVFRQPAGRAQASSP